MSDEYQLRKDIDKLFEDLYNLETGSVNVLRGSDLDEIRTSIEDLYDKMSNHYHEEFDTHLHDDWTVIPLTNGSLCVNQRLKLAQFHYLTSAQLVQNTWTTIATVTELASYPPYVVTDGNFYYSTSNPNITVRLYSDGTVKANTSLANGQYAVGFNMFYHYTEL